MVLSIWRRLVVLLPLSLFLCALARPASPAEVAAFVSGGSPAEDWSRGLGGTFTIVLFNLVHGEGEVARQPGEADDTGLLTLSGKAYVGPSIGRFVPYAGFGAGIYHASLPGEGDDGTFASAFIGAKLKAPLGVFVRAEYQWLDMPTTASPRLEERLLVGVGIAF